MKLALDSPVLSLFRLGQKIHTLIIPMEVELPAYSGRYFSPVKVPDVFGFGGVLGN